MKISTKVMNRILFSVVMLFFLTPLTVFAANKVVVIPLFDTTNPMPLKNIITVAKGNGNFTDPVAAVASITNASANNPYLVVIGPGVYTITQSLVMKPYVDIAGSGENVTKIAGGIGTGTSFASPIVRGSNNSALSSLTLEHTGGSHYATAMYNEDASPKVSNITATATGGTIHNFGIRNSVSSSPVMTNVAATASGSTTNYGVHNTSSSPVMTGVTALATGGTSYAVYNDSASPVIRRSTMSGDTAGLYTNNGTATVSQSTIKNGAVAVGGTNKCVACDKGDGTATDASCN